MTLVWLAAILAVIVFGLVFVCWDLRVTFTRAYRWAAVEADRAAREREDAAWAEFLAEADWRRRQLEQALEADGAPERLRRLVDAYAPGLEQALRVVA